MSLARTVFRRDPIPTLITVACSTLAWGVAIATTGAMAVNPTYQFLSALGDGCVVGCAASAIALGLFAAVLLGMQRLARLTVAIISLLWIALVAAILAGGFPGAAAWTYSVIGVSGLWSYLALGVRANGRH
jgi:hypothetical protein